MKQQKIEDYTAADEADQEEMRDLIAVCLERIYKIERNQLLTTIVLVLMALAELIRLIKG